MGYEDVVRLAQDREQLESHDSRRSAPDDDDDDDWHGSGRHGRTIRGEIIICRNRARQRG